MYRKVLFHFRRLSILDFTRKVTLYFIHCFERVNIFKSVRILFFFKTSSIRVGKNVRIHGLPFNIKIGDKTYFYDNCIFELGESSKVEIGSNVTFSYGVIFSARLSIVIGNDVQIGEYTSIRDSTHRYDDPEKPMKYSADALMPIVIGNNVWIGRGCLILPGSVIEEGVVVAANSVVKGRLEKDGIYGGRPAVFIKSRLGA